MVDHGPKTPGGAHDWEPLPPLDSFNSFRQHVWLQEVANKYTQLGTFYESARQNIVDHLWGINVTYKSKNNGKVLFDACDGRVKQIGSYLMKLYLACCEASAKEGMTRDVFDRCQKQIHDVVGVRFCVPYVDQILPTVQTIVRPALAVLHYGVDLSSDPSLVDRNYLTGPRPDGYRSYHFFVKVPVVVDIYGKIETCLCEVQARSELQHVWAVKSHDLFYKPDSGWVATDGRTKTDMVSVGTMLDQIDSILTSIRDRVTGEANR